MYKTPGLTGTAFPVSVFGQWKPSFPCAINLLITGRKRHAVALKGISCRFVNDELQTLGKKRGQLWEPSS